MENLLFIAPIAIVGVLLSLWLLTLRRVVPTNEVHIVQRAKTTTSYGKDTTDNKGNVYYEFPSWIPKLGVTKIVLPVSVFKLELDSYDAYDKDRLPFEIDVVAFFRVANSNVAAQRVSSIRDLEDQLSYIVKGAARTTLASYDINEIMVERAKFGDHFTNEVKEQLVNWGVEAVKNIELMDIRDAGDGKVIFNIMAKQKSLIEAQSRTEVAKNQQAAYTAEVQAQQEVDLRKQEAAQIVGLREAEVTRETGIANEQALQAVREQARITKEKDMAVLQVATVQEAQIAKEAGIVRAEQEAEVALRVKNANVTKAEEQKQVQLLNAEAQLARETNEAKAVELKGAAKAAAEQALLLAPVNAQITLADKIGQDEKYQQYLLGVEQIKASQAVGIAQAENIGKSQIKMLINTSDVDAGIKSAVDVLSPKGGMSLGATLEALSQTDMGKMLMKRMGISPVTEATNE